MVFAGTLNFNPLTDSIETPSGKKFKFSPPKGADLPAKGYDPGENTYQAPEANAASVAVAVDPKSDRLELLKPF